MASRKRPPENRDDSSSSGEIGHLAVGDEPCTFVQVRDVLYGCASSGNLWRKLLDIATSLKIPSGSIISLEKRIKNDTITNSGALLVILEAWRAKFSIEAKLQTLINVLENNGLTDCADSLKIHFNERYDAYVVSTLKNLMSTARSSTWENLPDHLKRWMNSKLVKFQGNENKLEELTAQVVFPVDDKILDELVKGNIPSIVNDNVPEHLQYYVHRTVTSRNILKLDVLKEECEDVFVIEGMEKHQLSSLVPDNESTNVSGNQLVRLTARFILLQYKPDFDKICKIATTPVHWVQYKNGTLEFIKSSGSVANLQKHVDDSQDPIIENELASSIQKVVVIADSPGMGKTCLLANIAHQIMREQPTMLVRFIVLKEFVDGLRNKEINAESIIKQIAKQSSEYEFGKKLVENALKTQECALLFDGLDEVLSNQMPTAKKILQAAAQLRSAKVFVATRPHLRVEIEDTLHVFAYTMQPFSKSNQINFLTEYWIKKGATPNESLTKFTENCVIQLRSKMRHQERSIAGIPLQCRMVGETYEDLAIRCSNVGYHSYESPDNVVMVDSIFGIYERHMQLRFDKKFKQESGRSEYENIKEAHMYFALKLLFPYHADKFKALNSSSVELHQLCGLGIVEATHSNDIRFVHRTFAEYLVAWLAHENIINNSPYRDLLLSAVLKVKAKKAEFYSVFSAYGLISLEAFEFDFSVICYFVNGFATKYAPTTPVIHNEEVLMPFYIASARHTYESIPHIVTHSVAQINPIKTRELISRNLFYIAARYSDLELMEIFCTKIDITKINFMKIEKSYKHETFLLTPLHVAIQRGHYRLVEYMLKKFEPISSQLYYLIHFCVSNSHKDSNSIMEDKIQIVKLLTKVNKNWVYEEDKNQNIALTQDSVHVRLLEYLIQEHGNLNTIDKDGNTLPCIIEHTNITSELLANSKQHGILSEHDCMELETLHSSLESKRFFEIVQNKSGSFERVYLIMRGYKHLSFAFNKLDACLYAARDKLRNQIFVKRNRRVKDLIDSNVNVIAVVTNDLELSVKRIQDTIDENVQVFMEHELDGQNTRRTGRQNNLLALQCDTLTTELVDKLVSLNRTCLCVCKQTHDGVEGCEIVTEAHDWTDISRFFIDKLWFRVDGNLYNFIDLFATPNVLGQIWQRIMHLYPWEILKLVKYKIVHEQSTYLSIEVFSHFLRDKLVFVNINEQDLKVYAKYGQKIGDPSQDIQSADYVILSGMHLFDNICKQANSNVHLIEHDDGCFKIVRTWGSQETVSKFLETTSCEFPFCHCPRSCNLVITFRAYYESNRKYELVKCELGDVLPEGRRVFGVEEQIDLFELRGPVHHLEQGDLNLQIFDTLKIKAQPVCYDQIVEIVDMLVKHLAYPEKSENFHQVAVNTLFPHLATTVHLDSGLDKYAHFELLEVNENNVLTFKHEVVATYFIAEMILENQDFVSCNDVLDEIFSNYFKPHQAYLSFISLNDNKWQTIPIISYKFAPKLLFKFFNFFAGKTEYADAFKILFDRKFSKQSVFKWMQAIVNDNLVNLFKIIVSTCRKPEGLNSIVKTHGVYYYRSLHSNYRYSIIFEQFRKNFESEELVVLAIIHGNASLVHLVTQQYKKQNTKELNKIQVPLINSNNTFESFFTLLNVAVLASNYSAFDYLFQYYFKDTVNQTEIQDLVYLCVAETSEHYQVQVDQRKLIITNILQNHPSLLQKEPKNYPLLAPNIHVDLIIHAINLDVDVNVTNEKKQNLLHLCAEYLTPEEYHRVVNAMVERQETELFHSRDEDQKTPLHVAVQHLELLDSTIQLFSSAKVDFNAVNKYENTALHDAVMIQRSGKILESLIKAGADEKVRGQYNRTVLHRAASYGNLTALKYFLLRGHDVNVTDEDIVSTPLHLAVQLSETNTHEVVVLLVESGADVNAINKFGRTPLDIANRGQSKVEARTKEYLEIAKMELLLMKWESEIIQHNMNKLSALANFESGLLQKLTSSGILTERDVEELESNESVLFRANKFFRMLLTTKYDFKILLSAFSESNNRAVLSIFVKEVISFLYNNLTNLEVSVVYHVMYTKGYADLLQMFVQFDEIDSQAYSNKLSIVQFICMLNPPKRPEMNTSDQPAINHCEKQREFIQKITTHNVNQSEIQDLVYLCLADTHEHSDVDERKLIITNILQIPPSLYHNQPNHYLLLAPNIHVDLIIHVINLGVDVIATNERKENLLHLCAKYLTPEEYHRVVNALVERQEIELFHSRDKDRKTPLHVAVKHMELLDSTIQLFSSAKVDFNAVDKYNDTVLHGAVICKRSERILNSLIKAGADENSRGLNECTVLHFAAGSGNLTALKYLISRGHNVNVTDEEGSTPLHFAVGFSTKNRHEQVVLLVEHGADVNVINKFGHTPLSIANDAESKVEARTKEYL